jgi:hypothetical protein
MKRSDFLNRFFVLIGLSSSSILINSCSLEKTLKRVTNSYKEIIVIKKSVQDSRIKIYSLNENYNLKEV